MKREIIYGDGNTFVHMAYMGEFWKNYVQDTAEHLFCLHASWDDEDYKEWLEEMSK